MAILILVLKIIGCILLTLFGICILLIGLVALIPIKYRCKLNIADFEEPEFNFSRQLEGTVGLFQASWLFHIIGFFVEVKGKDIIYGLTIFGFRKALKKHVNEETSTEIPKENANSNAKSNPREKQPELSALEKKIVDNENIAENSKAHKKETSNKAVDREKSTKKGRLKGVNRLWSELKNDENKALYHICLNELKYLCRHFGPRGMKGELEFSLGNPEYTGLFLGIISLFPVLYTKGFHIIPDFISEKIYLFGDIKIYGHVRIWHFARTFLHLVKNKKFRELLKTRR